MEQYLNMWKNYANFSDRTTVKGYWMAYLIYMITSAVFIWVITPLIGNAMGLGVELALDFIFIIVHLIPFLALTVRRLRDMGKNWTYMFIMLIPIVGAILYIIALCKPSIEDNGVPTV